MANEARFKKHRIWFAWNYRQEETWLTDQSAAGNQAVKPSGFSHEFEKDNSVRYVYRIDYQTNYRDKAEFANYVQLYADDGWEYVGTVSGIWHYFRKVRQGEETFELYTDRSSLKSLYRKIQGVLGAVAFANLVPFLINAWNLLFHFTDDGKWMLSVPVLTLYAALIGLLFYGFVRMGRMAKQTDAF